MDQPVVMLTTFDRFEEVMSELRDVLEGHNILIRMVTDEAFDAFVKPEQKKTDTEMYRDRLKVILLGLEDRSIKRLRYLIEQPEMNPADVLESVESIEQSLQVMKTPLIQMQAKEAEVQIDLSDEEFTILAKIAHERDITFNQLVNDVLREELNKIEEDSLQRPS